MFSSFFLALVATVRWESVGPGRKEINATSLRARTYIHIYIYTHPSYSCRSFAIQPTQMHDDSEKYYYIADDDNVIGHTTESAPDCSICIYGVGNYWIPHARTCVDIYIYVLTAKKSFPRRLRTPTTYVRAGTSRRGRLPAETARTHTHTYI